MIRVVYQSFHGRYADSPRAIHERLAGAEGLDQLWLADPAHRAGFPAHVRTVDHDSDDARDALDSADLVIANTHTEVPWRKARGTTYVQTWHGTPLKRVHRDVLFSPTGVLDHLDRDIARWDLLLSPNPVSTPRLRRAFGYTGPIAETGYPRNDVLLAPGAAAVRDRVRAGLGLAPGTVAVLYAPTWRDDEYFREGRPQVGFALGPEHFAGRLGDGTTLLVRAHNLLTSRHVPPHGPGVVDVSSHPEMSDLLLAADVLVTDYSSSMFDFALTGKPIVLYPYDLDRFRDQTRGFYFDLFADAPGPVVTTGEGVAAAVADLEGLRTSYAEPYRRFVEVFGCLEDGQASDRVLAELGLDPGSASPRELEDERAS